MSSYGKYFGAQPGIQAASQTLMTAPMLAQRAYDDAADAEMKRGLIVEQLRKLSADAGKTELDMRNLQGAPGRFDRAAAANYGTTLPDMAQARSMIANPESPLIEGPRWTDTPDFRRAARAVSEAEIASANPEKNTLTNFGSYRENMGKADAVTEALSRIRSGNLSGAYDITGPVLGHNAPREAKPAMRERVIGDTMIQEELRPDGTWVEVGRGPRFAKQIPSVVVGGEGQRVPQGYRATADGNLEPIPGGPADPARKPKDKSLPLPAIRELSDVGATAMNFQRLANTFQDDFGGKTAGLIGDAQNLAGRNLEGSKYADQAQWWQDYQNEKNIIRNRLFGSALTATEKAEFDKAQITPGMTATAIRANLARQQDITMRAARKIATALRSGGYSDEQIENALGMSLEAVAQQPAPAARPAPAAPSQGSGWSIRRLP